MRYQFNHTTNKNLMIISSDSAMVSQIKEDNTPYEYKGQSLNYRYLSEDVHNFQIVRPVSELRIVDGELTIDSFFNEYDAWICRKQAAFAKMKADIDAEEIRRVEAEKLRAKQFEETRKRQFQIEQMQFLRQDYDRDYAKLNKPLIPYRQKGATFGNVSDYNVGIRVLHSKYGYGQIVEFKDKPHSSNHLIKILRQ